MALLTWFMLGNVRKSILPNGKDFIPTCAIRNNIMPLNVKIVVYLSLLALDTGRGKLGTMNFNLLRMDVASFTFPVAYFNIHM